jgi:hypothetical protein
MRRPLLASLLALSLGSCRHEAPPPATAVAPPDSSAPTLEPAALAAPTVAAPAPTVPTVTLGWTDPDPGTTPLAIAPDHIALGTGAPIVRLLAGEVASADLRGGEGSFLVPSVHRAIADRTPSTTSLTLAIHPSIPYRTIVRVVYSASQAAVTAIQLAVLVQGVPRVIPINRPSASDAEPGAPSSSSIFLTAALTSDGVIVSGVGGKLAPGCERVEQGSGVTVPRTPTGTDVATLVSCLERIHAQFPAENTVIFSADPTVPFADLAPAIAAARGTPSAPIFPRALLSAGVR